ncbi:MAG TPA: sodium:solute symporter [bacterium]|nr:sodium:solute symporter [bacterium]HPN45215.1 sodium:solute symporter [bacterium]
METQVINTGAAPVGIMPVDIVVIIVYLVGIVALGIWAGLRKKQGHGANDYFLAGKSLGWPMIGMALFATNISCVHLVSLAQAGYDTGLLMGNFEWMAAFTLVLLGLFFAPFYIRSRVATLPDFLEKRYCRQCRDWLAVLSMISAITIHIGFSMVTGSIVLHGMFGINIWVSIVAMAVLTGLYTIIGGLMAVVVTETIQTVVLLIGATIITIFAFIKVGGWSGMTSTLDTAEELRKLSMLRPHGDANGMPWYAIFLGYPVLGIWYWCADQTIVQRVLGAKNENHARIGPIFAGLIKILPVFIFVLPGLVFYAILDKGIMTIPVNNSKEVYALMIQYLLPAGLTGVMAAALMAALMSTVSGALNSVSTLFSYDLYKRFRPKTTDKQLVNVGRIAAFFAMLIAIGLVPLLNSYQSIFEGLNDIISHIAPPVTTVFLLGIFWPRASAASAKLTLWIGSGLGALIFVLKNMHRIYPDTFSFVPGFIIHTPFMMMAFYLLVVCIILQVSFTFAFPKQKHEDAEKLYWPTPFMALKDKGWPGLGNYKLLSVLLLGIMAVLYIIFH